MTDDRLYGTVASGLGTAPNFLAIPWVAEAVARALGTEPYPGTLNLVGPDAGPPLPRQWADHPVIPLRGRDGICDGVFYPVRIADAIPALAVVPLIPNYPPDKIELIAPVHVRQTLGLAEGDRVAVRPAPPPVLAGCKAVLFDVDGTLLDSAESYYQILYVACEEIGITPPDRSIVPLMMNEGRQVTDVLFPADQPDRMEQMARLSAAIQGAWPRFFPSLVSVLPGAAEALQQLKQTGLRLGVVTSSRRRVLAPLAGSGIDRMMEVVVTSEDVKPKKPDPAPLLHALSLLGLPAREVAYVGDTPMDITAARAAGMPAIGVTTGTADRPLLSREQPDLIIDSLRWLPGLFG